MQYEIGAFARRTGLSAHTLRYYEKEGLLTPARNAAGRRLYGEADAAWAAFLLRLKETGMPIREMRGYAALRAQGPGTLAARLRLLEQHQGRLRAQLRRLEEHSARLDEKIAWYRAALANEFD